MTPLPPMDQVIDYAVAEERAEELDVFFCAAAKFMFAVSSGISRGQLLWHACARRKYFSVRRLSLFGKRFIYSQASSSPCHQRIRETVEPRFG